MEFGLLLRALGGIWIILAVAVGFGAAAHFQGQRTEAVYEANAMLLYRFGREYSHENPLDTTWRGDQIRVDIDLAINNELEIMGSRLVLEKTLEQLGIVAPENQELALQLLEPGTPDLSGPQQLAEFRESLSIRRIQGTNMVRISAMSPDVEQAVVTLETLLGVYIGERDRLLETQPLDSLYSTRETLLANIEVLRESDIAMRNEFGVFETGQQRGAILDRIRTLETAPITQPVAPVPGAVVVPSNVLPQQDIDAELLALRLRLEEIEAVSSELRDIARKREGLEDELGVLDNLIREYELANAFQNELGHPIAMVEEPAPSPTPVGLSPTMQTALAAIIGALVGYLISIIRESLRRRKPEPGLSGNATAES